MQLLLSADSVKATCNFDATPELRWFCRYGSFPLSQSRIRRKGRPRVGEMAQAMGPFWGRCPLKVGMRLFGQKNQDRHPVAPLLKASGNTS